MNQKTAPQHSRTQDNYRDMGVLTARRQHPKDEGAWRGAVTSLDAGNTSQEPSLSQESTSPWHGECEAVWPLPQLTKATKATSHLHTRDEGGIGKYGVPCQGRCWFPSILYCTGARLSSRKQKEASMHASSISNCNSREQFWHTGPL